jgi:hypothetical protein
VPFSKVSPVKRINSGRCVTVYGLFGGKKDNENGGDGSSKVCSYLFNFTEIYKINNLYTCVFYWSATTTTMPLIPNKLG